MEDSLGVDLEAAEEVNQISGIFDIIAVGPVAMATTQLGEMLRPEGPEEDLLQILFFNSMIVPIEGHEKLAIRVMMHKREHVTAPLLQICANFSMTRTLTKGISLRGGRTVYTSFRLNLKIFRFLNLTAVMRRRLSDFRSRSSSPSSSFVRADGLGTFGDGHDVVG